MAVLFGQEKIKEEIDFLVQDILNGGNHNILLRAPSGYGKTALALNILWVLGWDKYGEYLLPEDGKITLDARKKFHVIDEVHTLQVPEFLYPIMDNKQHSFILCSNESGKLLEPLRNRCIQFIFSPYSDEEMFKMLKHFLVKYNLSDEMLSIIRERTKNNPRVATKICERLDYIFSWKGIPRNTEDLENILEKTLNIQRGGLNQNDLTYLSFLSSAKTASLESISVATGIDKTTIQTEIEPFLLFKGMIKISSRGRTYAL